MRYSTRLSLSLTLLSWTAVVRSQNCLLKVPQNPLTAEGLATPYEMTGCNQINFANEGCFVEAAILDPATGSIQIYSPLVINAGMMPIQNATNATATSSAAAAASMAGFYVPPIVPTLPDNAVVGIWFGSNANTLTLTGHTGGCVNGLPNSVFGQFAYCNGEAWFNAAKTAVNQGLTKIPVPGIGTNGQACPTTHDFRIVDQDPSDNVVTTYLLIDNNTLAQNTPTNSQANPNAEVLSNASDNALVTDFIDPALGCQPFQHPCTTCPTGQGAALATDELQAFFFPPAGGPALIPLNDDMVVISATVDSLQKVNLYRVGTGQPKADNNNASGLIYCEQISQGGLFINQNQGLFSNSPSPAPAQATNLFTFLALRFAASIGPFPGLQCTTLLNMTNPVTLTTDNNGVVTAATINTQVLEQNLAMVTGGTTSASATATTVATTSATSASSSSVTSATSSAAATSSVTVASSVAATSSAATTSAPTSVTSSSAVTSSAAATSSATSTTSAAVASPSAVASSAAATSSAATSSAAAASSAATASSVTATTSAATTSAPTSATGVLLQNTGTTSAIPTSSIPAVTPTSTQCVTAAALNPSTVTVTVTATVCPSQSWASATPSASATSCHSNWDGKHWRSGESGGSNWKRSAQMTRTHRKSRISSFE